jgi:hypothetical protein
MKELSTPIEINATAARVWGILADIGRYAKWNPFIRLAQGETREGSKLTVQIQTPGGKAGLRRHECGAEKGG